MTKILMGASVHPFTHAHEFGAGGVKMIAPTCRATDHKNANVIWSYEESKDDKACDTTRPEHQGDKGE